MSEELPVIDTRAAWQAALRWGLDEALARERPAHHLRRRRFRDLALDDAAVLERLTAWLRLPQRRLVLLAGRLRRDAAPLAALHGLAPRLRARRRRLAGRGGTGGRAAELLLDDGPRQRAADRQPALARAAQSLDARTAIGLARAD